MTGEPPGSVRGCAVGRSGSGKTRWIHRRWIANCPRVLIVDQTGEWRRLEPNARFSMGYADTVRVLKQVASERHWRVVATLDVEEVERLIQVLIPIPDIQKSPVLALGGFALYLDEVDLVVPLNAGPIARNIYRRSRHAGMTVLSATQRISSVNKEVTSMCDFIGVLDVHELADVDYLENLMGRAEWEKARDWIKQPYHVAVWRPSLRALILLPPEPL